MFIVISFWDDGVCEYCWGPFSSRSDAERFADAIRNETSHAAQVLDMHPVPPGYRTLEFTPEQEAEINQGYRLIGDPFDKDP